MNQNEFKRIASVIRGFYPTLQVGVEADVTNVWLEAFSRYDADVVMRAVKDYGDSQKFPPSVSDIKELIKNTFRQNQSTSDCPKCDGRGYVLVHIKNELTNRLYNGQDWANDFAVSCPLCHGWNYVPYQKSEERKK